MVKSGYDLNLIFQALGDPTRRSILRNVSRRERTVMEVAKPFHMSLAAVSKHLKVLERAKLIHREKRGSFSHVQLNAEALRNAQRWIDDYRQFWEMRLDSLKDYLEKDSK